MSFLQNLLGNSESQQGFQDFVNRYQQGQPQEGYSNQEVMNRFQQIAPQLPQQDFVQAAEAAFTNMTPQQRSEFGQYLQQQAQQQHVPLPMPPDMPMQQMQNPGMLAQMAGQMHQQQPGGLAQLLGGGSSLNNPVVKAALAGITAMAAQRIMGGR